jgi:hypothetical protein
MTRLAFALFCLSVALAAGCEGVVPPSTEAGTVRADGSRDAVRESADERPDAPGIGTDAEAGDDLDASVSFDVALESSPTDAPDGPIDAGSEEGATADADATPDAAPDGFGGGVASDASDANDTGDASRLIGIVITPPNAATVPHTNVSLTATGTFYDVATNQTSVRDLTPFVTWSTTPSNVAFVSNMSGFQGRVTALNTGNAMVTATLGDISGSTSFTTMTGELFDVAIEPMGIVMFPLHANRQLSASVTTTTRPLDVTSNGHWTSSNPAVASFDGAGGVMTTKQTGYTTITYEGLALGKTTDSIAIGVAAANLVLIKVSPAPASVGNGAKWRYRATGTFTDASEQDIGLDVTWTSSDESVAKVDAMGFATAVGPGHAMIRASIANLMGEVAVDVTTAALARVDVACKLTFVPPFTDPGCRATAVFSDGSTLDVTDLAGWSPAIGVEWLLGPQTIKAGYLGATGSISVTVVEAYLSSIAITPPQPTVKLGPPLPFRAVGTFLTSPMPFEQDLTNDVTWSTSNPAVARIRNLAGHGQAVMLSTGTTTIGASFGNVSASTSLSIADP